MLSLTRYVTDYVNSIRTKAEVADILISYDAYREHPHADAELVLYHASKLVNLANLNINHADIHPGSDMAILIDALGYACARNLAGRFIDYCMD
jgi:hypothetical protein